MRLVAYDPQRHGSSRVPMMPRSMAAQLEWLAKGSALTVYIPCSEHHPDATIYSAGALHKIAVDRDDERRLADPADRESWLHLLIAWAHDLTETGGRT